MTCALLKASPWKEKTHVGEISGAWGLRGTVVSRRPTYLYVVQTLRSGTDTPWWSSPPWFLFPSQNLLRSPEWNASFLSTGLRWWKVFLKARGSSNKNRNKWLQKSSSPSSYRCLCWSHGILGRPPSLQSPQPGWPEPAWPPCTPPTQPPSYMPRRLWTLDHIF